ncbi:MAG: phage baseplate protein [Oscillospiraceae bacterium]
MAKATQPVSINGLEFDALISESRTLEATVPEYSVETGFSVSDSIILSPEKMEMTLFVTNTPVTWYRRHGASQNRMDSVVKQLEELYFAKEPVTIVTSDATYTNMAIESMTISKSLEVGYAREIPISFKKIRITSAKTTTIPDSYGKSGATAASVGTASTSAASSGGSGTGSGSGSGGGTGSSSSSGSNGNSKSSILYNAASSIGLI